MTTPVKQDANSILAHFGITHLGNVEAVLAHFGVPGMKWGVRKDRGNRDEIFRKRAKEAQEVNVKTAPGKKVRTSGGKYNPPSEDAIRAATNRQKARQSTTDSLSNKELQDVITRMNMERQYSQLVGERQPLALALGKKTASFLLKNTADDQIDELESFLTDKTGNRAAGAASTIGVKAARDAATASTSKKKK